MKDEKQELLMEKIVSLAKRRGFVFQGSEIYGGLAGTWDYGPRGVALKNNIKNLWWRMFVESRDDMYAVDAAILMNEKVWKASGHTGAGFTDPVVICNKCKNRFRGDNVKFKKDDDGKISERVWICEKCGTENDFETKQFNLMFETKVGAEGTIKSYLRPETAQGIFVNFKNIVDSMNPKLPFGIAQIGKAFRNEIAPRDFVFRTREFEQMEIEYFVKEDTWEDHFNEWLGRMYSWMEAIGLQKKDIHELDVPESDRAHYSKKTVDFEFDFPFGRKELYGLAYRTDFDLKNHTEHSGESLTYFDNEAKEHLTPHVIEPTFGVDRTVLAVLTSAYTEDELGGSVSADSGEPKEKRVYLAFKPSIAPVKAAVFPLLKNKPELVAKAREVYTELKKHVPQVMFDDNGNVGKRYRRQDEIGTPVTIVADFQTLDDDTVTMRDRDTGEQERLSINEAISKIKDASMLG
ncbi:glycine--tRNA ligase [Candidatus Kaiserbacteria bacterium CG10_big_fil_rev_8_21_14_0_10_45_20]|uniref:glycine--tRNA ligase n=1 Tax=Candidatus Kaiserbacteria bacterium CG10_big_fil_rev_8_21_14_0_10_45_20 TaxID=1974607 RepID=A0A2H0UF15_9BACT|nr:MAG: glycine--tRNA ligase [Candidatus Kaiserbacteria bacterium CG10_big_fil_rev_8_21_14_0_10_45_20]